MGEHELFIQNTNGKLHLVLPTQSDAAQAARPTQPPAEAVADLPRLEGTADVRENTTLVNPGFVYAQQPSFVSCH